MAKAVLIENEGSIYRDEPFVRYHQPARLRPWTRQIGHDWVVFYRGRRGGAEGYYAAQKARSLVDDPADPANFSFIELDPESVLSFEQLVPRLRPGGIPFESGLPKMGGFNTQAVRIISDLDFEAIIELGLREIDDPLSLPRQPEAAFPGLSEAGTAFLLEPRTRLLTNRAFRDASFQRQVKRAYRGRCAMSGLSLRNGGGRPEVQAAHIRSVAGSGPDTVRNGLALSGTLHWMFDRGLVSVDDDLTILVKKGSDAELVANRLLTPDRRLQIPSDPRLQPHPAYLRWHRETVFSR